MNTPLVQPAGAAQPALPELHDLRTASALAEPSATSSTRPRGLSRRRVLLAGGAVWASASVWAATTHAATLPMVSSLPDELALALKKNEPLVVMVSLVGCPFCHVARESYLAPLRREEGLPVVQIDMRNRQNVTDFQGQTLTQDELIRRWGVKVAPTVLFFGRGGVEIAERLVGGYIPDFYGAYLDERIKQARSVVKAKG